MNRLALQRPLIVTTAGILLLLTALFANAADRDHFAPDSTLLATTGRIVSMDLKNKTFKVRASEGFSGPTVLLVGGAGIHLPGHAANEYTVVTTGKTLFQDGGESITMEDFKTGETISIHGTLNGTTLTATRIAKWS